MSIDKVVATLQIVVFCTISSRFLIFSCCTNLANCSLIHPDGR